jgi:hypothetical protein
MKTYEITVLAKDGERGAPYVLQDRCTLSAGNTAGAAAQYAALFPEPGPSKTELTFNRIWDVADDFEADVLTSLLLKAGLLWECARRGEDGHACGYRNDESARECEDCGAPRPAREGEENANDAGDRNAMRDVRD